MFAQLGKAELRNNTSLVHMHLLHMLSTPFYLQPHILNNYHQ